MTGDAVKRSTTLTAEQNRRVTLMRSKGWTPENIADIFDNDPESVKLYLHRRETAGEKPKYPRYTPPDPDEDGLTELQRKERRASASAFEEMRERGKSPQSCKTVRWERDDDPVKWSNPSLRSKRRQVDAKSTNVGIPEKFRGWEFQDIQYQGGM
jgi:hypothetical protein